MAGNPVVGVGPSDERTLRIRGRATDSRCHGPSTKLERRLARVCSRRAEHRLEQEVSWLASHLQRIPHLQHVPPWKLERVGRDMSIVFTRDGDDASAVCTDPASSYFLVTGSLMPTEVGAKRAPLSSLLSSAPELDGGGSRHPAPTEGPAAEVQSRAGLSPARFVREEDGEVALPGERDIKGNERGEVPPDPVACGVERPELAARDASADSPCENGAQGVGGSVRSPAALGKEGLAEDGSDIESKSVFSVPTTTLTEVHPPPFASDAQEAVVSKAQGTPDAGARRRGPLLPGQSLDVYLRCLASSSGQAPEKVGLEGVDSVEPVGRGVVHVFAGGSSNCMASTAWHLDAREASCIGRVSRRLLCELEREEQKHEVEEKVSFLRKTEVFRDGFSAAALWRLAVLMEHQREPEAAVVRRKGSAVDTILIVESGEAIRLGDPRADSVKNYSSLRVRAGQMFGAEEALSGLPGYTGNLMAMSALEFFAIPAEAFLRATEGISSNPLYQLRSKALVVNHGCRTNLDGRPRPSTAPGMSGECSGRRKWSSDCVALSETEGESSLPTLLAPSKTRLLPVTLTPLPLFSGPRAETTLAKRMNTMAAVWTPWAWACSDDEQGNHVRDEHQRGLQQQRQQRQEQLQHQGQQPHLSPSVSRPHSAPPASAPKNSLPTSGLVQHVMHPPEWDGTTALDDDDVGSPPLPSAPSPSLPAKSGKTSSTGDLTLRADGGAEAAARRAFSQFWDAETRDDEGKGRGADATGRGRRRGQAAPSPDFKRLGPSIASSSSLAGCDFNALATMSAVAVSSAVGSSSERKTHESGGFRPQAVGARTKSRLLSPRSKGDRNYHPLMWIHERPETACHPSNDTDDEYHTTTLDFSLPTRTGGMMCGRKSISAGTDGGSELVGFIVDGVDGHSGDGCRDVEGAGLHFPRRDFSRRAMPRTSSRVLPRSARSSPSSPSSGGRPAPSPTTLEGPCSKGELKEARLAVSSRPRRRRLCSAFRAHEPASAGMAAAQRAYRGAFVVNKMGDAKARSTWRP